MFSLQIKCVASVFSGGFYSREAFLLTSSSSSWTSLPPMSTVRVYQVCVVYQGEVWVMGGWRNNDDYVTTTEILSLTSHTWRTGHSLLTESASWRWIWFHGLVYQGHLYGIIWPHSDRTFLLRLDQETETWEKYFLRPVPPTSFMYDSQVIKVPGFC